MDRAEEEGHDRRLLSRVAALLLAVVVICVATRSADEGSKSRTSLSEAMRQQLDASMFKTSDTHKTKLVPTKAHAQTQQKSPPLWVRVPLPDVKLRPVKGVPEVWWKERTRLNNADKVHNVVWQPGETDPTFYSDLVVTKGMKAKAHRMTNGERRRAVTQCLVALRQILYEDEYFASKAARFWLEGGTLLASNLGGRGGHYIPWDVDGDVAMSLPDWYRVRSFLNESTAKRPPPENNLPARYADCGCLLVDMDSFGSKRPSAIPGISGIPGRIFNECTGNWIDIFGVFNRRQAIEHHSTDARTTSAKAEGVLYNTLPQGSMLDGPLFSYKEETVYPLRNCSFEDAEYDCPADTRRYLVIEEGKDAFSPDHMWDAKTKTWVITPEAARDGSGAMAVCTHGCQSRQLEANKVTPAEKRMCRFAAKGLFPPAVVKGLKGCSKAQLARARQNFRGFKKFKKEK